MICKLNGQFIDKTLTTQNTQNNNNINNNNKSSYFLFNKRQNQIILKKCFIIEISNSEEGLQSRCMSQNRKSYFFLVRLNFRFYCMTHNTRF
jgi:hypothetical protein